LAGEKRLGLQKAMRQPRTKKTKSKLTHYLPASTLDNLGALA
jgi:hypothetical protein